MKKVRIKSPIPVYTAAALWILMGLITPIYTLPMILLTAVVSVIGYLLASIVFKGQEIEVRSKAESGDAELDRRIDDGRAMVQRIREANAAIPDPKLSALMDRMERAADAIFDAVEKDTSRASQVRRFMTYYLPTTDKLLERYRELSQVEAPGENISGAIATISRSMELIATAFEKQLDALYRDSALDIETDISALETMLKTEGHNAQGITLGGR